MTKPSRKVVPSSMVMGTKDMTQPYWQTVSGYITVISHQGTLVSIRMKYSAGGDSGLAGVRCQRLTTHNTRPIDLHVL